MLFFKQKKAKTILSILLEKDERLKKVPPQLQQPRLQKIRAGRRQKNPSVRELHRMLPGELPEQLEPLNRLHRRLLRVLLLI